MADEIGGLSVRLDANGTGLDAVLARGEQRVRVFADRTTAALDNPIFNSAGAAAARRIADALESEFQARSARIQEAVRQGLMSPEEAQEAGRDIAREFNKGLIGGVQALGQQTDPGNLALMGVRLKEVGRSASAAADGVKKVGAAAGGSGFNFRRLTGSLTSVAASVLPVHGGVLRLSTVLSSMALSGGITVGVIAGAAAIAGVWNLMTRRARELRTAADEAATAVRDMFLEEQTQGDIRLINLMDDLGAQVDELARKLRELPPQGQGDVVTEAFRTATQKQIDELIRRRDDAQALLDKRRALRREEDRKAEQEAADDAKRAAQERLEALTALVAAGRATAAETDELRKAQAALLETMRDGTQSVNDRAAAMENLTRVTEALTQAQLRQIRLADIGPRGRAGIPGVPTARGNLLRAPRSVEPITPRADILAAPPRDVLGGLAAGAQVGGAGGEIMQVAQAAAAGLGPFAALLPVINAALEALEPVLTLLLEPVKVIGKLLAAQLTPIIKILIPPLRILAIVSSYVTQGLGWLLEAIGRFVNAIVPFGDPASGLVRAGKEMQRSAKEARDSLKDLGETADSVASSLRNVPLSFDVAFARFRIASGQVGSRQAVPRSGFTVNGDVIIQSSPTGDTPQSLWQKFQQGMRYAAAGGDPDARAIMGVT